MTQNIRRSQNSKQRKEVMEVGTDNHKVEQRKTYLDILEELKGEYPEEDIPLVQKALEELSDSFESSSINDLRVQVAYLVISFQREALTQSRQEAQMLKRELENSNKKESNTSESLQQYAQYLVANSQNPVEYFKVCGAFYIYMMRDRLDELGITLVPGSNLDSRLSRMAHLRDNDLRNAIVSVLRVFGGITVDGEWQGEVSRITHGVSTRSSRKDSGKPPHTRWLITDAIAAFEGIDNSDLESKESLPIIEAIEQKSLDDEPFPEF